MSAVPRESALRVVAMQLDRAVADTVRHWTIVIPFVLLDGVTTVAVNGHNWLFDFVLLSILENRVLVIAIEMLATRRRFAWTATLRYPRSLWFMVAEPLSPLPMGLVVIAVLAPFAIVQSGRLLMYGAVGQTVAMLLVLLACCLCCVAAVPVALLILAALAAMMDVVADGGSARSSFVDWLRRCFRRRTLGSTLLAATVFLLLYSAVSLLTDVIPTPNRWIQALLNGPVDGVADALSIVYLWHWRLWRLNLDRGNDLAAELRPIDVAG